MEELLLKIALGKIGSVLPDAIVSKGSVTHTLLIYQNYSRLMLNLLRNNSSNQTFFREGSYIQRISCFFELDLDQDEIEVGWSAQKVSNMLHMLQVLLIRNPFFQMKMIK